MRFRLTPQRRVILEELRKADSHLTADDIYHRVRVHQPRISLGTVYRNLEILGQLGMIKKLEIGGTQKRFDAITRDHYHVRCLSCGRIDDAPMEQQKELEATLQGLTDYQITGHRLEFVGFCFQCREEPQAKMHGRTTEQELKKQA